MSKKFIVNLKNTSIVKDYIDGDSTMGLGNTYNIYLQFLSMQLLLYLIFPLCHNLPLQLVMDI